MRSAGAGRTQREVYTRKFKNGGQVHRYGRVQHLEYRSRAHHHGILLFPYDVEALNNGFRTTVIAVDNTCLMLMHIVNIHTSLLQGLQCGDICIFSLFRHHDAGAPVK
ncbi:hypothetical protein D3C80_1813540 [compost metagenome]